MIGFWLVFNPQLLEGVLFWTAMSIFQDFRGHWITSKADQLLTAQPLGRFRFLDAILAGKNKSKLRVFSLSLSQVG